MTADELLKNDFRFRKPSTVDAVTINGQKYQVIVPSGSAGKNYNKSYAYDPTTGKVRRLKETLIGIPNKFWEDGYDWEDIEAIFKKGGRLIKMTNSY
jgi:hypothetical protein